MLAADAVSEFLETTLNINVEPYLLGACSFLDIAEEQVQLVSEYFTQDILLDALGNHYDLSKHDIGSDNDHQALLFILLVLTTRGGTGVPLEDSYIAMQLLARLMPLSANFIDMILCAFAGGISSGITVLEQASIQGKTRSKTLSSHTPVSTRRATQNIVNSQSSVGSQEDYTLLLDMDTESIDLTASSVTIITAIITAFNSMAAFFRESLDCTPQLNTLTYLRTMASETVVRLINKPLKHITYTEAPAPAIIRAIFKMLEALMDSLTAYRGIFLYDFVRLLVLNPHGKYKVISSLSVESVSLVQTLSHECICRTCLPLSSSTLFSSADLDTFLSVYLPLLQFSLLSIHDLSAIRLCGASAITRLIDAILCTFNTTETETKISAKYQELFFTRLISFLHSLVNQPKATHKLAVLDLLAAVFINKAICSKLEASTDFLERICIDLLFPLACDQDDSVAASTLNLLTRSYSDKTISRYITLLVYPLCLSFTLSFRANIKLHLVIQSVALRKATTYFLGSCIIHDTSKLIDVVISKLKFPNSRSNNNSDSDEPSEEQHSSPQSVQTSRPSNEVNTEEEEPLSLSMLNDSADDGLSPPYQSMLTFLSTSLSDRGLELLSLARKRLYGLLNNLKVSHINVSIKDLLMDELSVRCQDSSPVVRKLAINTMLECANVIPLSLWFECVFNSRGESVDGSTNIVLEHAMEILLHPILDCLQNNDSSIESVECKISPLFGGVLFHLAPKYEGAEQRVTITSLSYTIRNVLKQHNLSEYLQLLNCAIEAPLKLTQTDQVACGALVLAIGCTIMLVHCYEGTFAVDDTAAINLPFSYVAPLTATGSIGPVGLATIYNPVLTTSFETDTIGVGLSYLFLSCISLLYDFLQNEDPQHISSLMFAIDRDNLTRVFLQKIDLLLGFLDLKHHNANLVEKPCVFSDSVVLIMKNILEGVACFLRIYQLSDTSLGNQCKRFLLKCIPLVEISIHMLCTVFPEFADAEHDCPSTQSSIHQEECPRTGHTSFSLGYLDAMVGHTSCLSHIVRISTSIFLNGELPSTITRLQILLSNIQTAVLTRLQCITIHASTLLERKIDTSTSPSTSTIIQQLIEGLALSSTEFTDLRNGTPPTCQLYFHVLRNIVSEGLLEQLGTMQSTQFNDICLGVTLLIGDFRTYMTELVHRNNDNCSPDLHVVSKMLQLCDNLSGTLISCIGYHVLHLDPFKNAPTLTAYLSSLSHISLKHCSPQARNNSFLTIMSLCYLVPDMAGNHLTILLPLMEECSPLIRRQVLLVISDLLLKEYLRREPALVLALYSLIAKETNYEFRLFARRICIEPLLKKVPTFITHSFLDVLLMLSGSQNFTRCPITLIAFKIMEITSFSGPEGLRGVHNADSEKELREKLVKTLSIQSSTQRYDFYVFLLTLLTPPKRFEILSILLKEFLDKIDEYPTLLSVYSALDDILQLLVAGFFEYKVDTLAHQLPESQHSQDDVLSAEKAAFVVSVIGRLSDKYSLDRLLPALLRIYSLCRDNQLSLTVKLSEAIHSVLRRSRISIVDLKEAYPQFGAELLELKLLEGIDGTRQI
ncbi:Hypothetical protein GLP15_3458 [Giardia lamblia P15]|uniref:Uncharacterized protein n=1 Tax=Giardia intestinalis (strain P15) TaxID=658858 RepID=E1F0C9_GIAIA|nr:Hypothetical protein GLP15_3458 [Giardia lamblia P15]